MNEKSSSEGSPFSLGNLFKGKPTSESGATTTSLRGNKGTLEPHPSVRPHVSPLNRLMEKTAEAKAHDLKLSPSIPMYTAVSSERSSLHYPPNKSPWVVSKRICRSFSGSADELEPQQVLRISPSTCHMGSRKRERLFGTGSQTNAHGLSPHCLTPLARCRPWEEHILSHGVGCLGR
jgi:hypothetical protein